MDECASTEVVGRAGKFALVDAAAFWEAVKAMGLGDGEVAVLRLERPEQAAWHGHHKHLHGHLLKPVSDFTGDTVTELKDRVKALFLPEGMTSTRQMSAEQFRDFNETVESYFLQKVPEAFIRQETR